MPHLLLEYTGNIQTNIDFKALFTSLHTLLFELAKAEISNCKSRAIRLENYTFGDGNSNNAFAHLDILMMAGRTPEVKKQLGEKSLAVIKHYFQEAIDENSIRLTVRISDIPPESYFKTSLPG